jgi:hypothetical protein
MKDEIHINMTALPRPTGTDGAGEHEKDTLAPTAADADSTYLRPHDAFPLELPAVSTGELHILYSRVCRQLDREYVFGPGPHPETHGRFHELSAELDARETARTRIE